MSAPVEGALAWLAAHRRWRPWEYAIWAVALSAAFVAPQHASLFNEIAILALFAVSLDLVLGLAGIVSLGHAAFFGLGAYGAALFAKHYNADPLLGLAVAAALGAGLGAVTSLMVLRGSALTQLMVTLGVSLILFELANKLDWLTGGADGLQGVVMNPLLGRFEWDLGGRTAYGYSLAVLFVLFVVARRLMHSTWGLSLQAIRDNRVRAGAIGMDANKRLAAVYTVAGSVGAVSGALLAQTTGFASLDVLDMHRSADVLLVLVIGGTGWLYGGVLGAVAFKVMHDLLSAVTPQYWQFWMGLILVTFVMIGRDRMGGWIRRLRGGGAEGARGATAVAAAPGTTDGGAR